MNGSTHLAGGLLAGAIVAKATGASGQNLAIGMAVAGLAGLVPDWVQINLPGANSVVRGVVGHRGISHWIITAFAVSLALYMVGYENLAMYVLGGWLSHVALDLLSGGMATFWPWPGRVTMAKIKTGGQHDRIVGACCLVLATTIIVGVIWL